MHRVRLMLGTANFGLGLDHNHRRDFLEDRSEWRSPRSKFIREQLLLHGIIEDSDLSSFKARIVTPEEAASLEKMAKAILQGVNTCAQKLDVSDAGSCVDETVHDFLQWNKPLQLIIHKTINELIRNVFNVTPAK